MKTILVTGAGGVIGGRLVETLALSDPSRVRAGVRQWSSAARIARFPVEIVLCDVMDREQLRAAIAGVQAVVHCAYSYDHAVIVQGTRNLLEAALEAKIDRVVHLSTAEVYGQHVSGDIHEEFPCQSSGWDYADAKIEAERACWEFYQKGLPVTVMRPTIVYGPFSKIWTVAYAERFQSGNWGLFDGYGGGICNLVYVDDVVVALLGAVHRAGAVGQAFNVNGAERLTWNEYFERFNAALGLSPLPRISLQQSRVRAKTRELMGRVIGPIVSRYKDRLMGIYSRNGAASKLMKLVKHTMNTTPTVDDLEHLYSRQAFYRTDKARELLGYVPRYTLDEGLRMSVLWLKHHGYLRHVPAPSQLATGGHQ